jgi:hypothetical protein
MYIVPIAWLYVALLMSVAEASNSTGSVLGAVITFVLYGLLPVGLVMYIMGTPGRKRMLRAKEQAELQAALAAQPDAGSHAPADPVAPVREKD